MSKIKKKRSYNTYIFVFFTIVISFYLSIKNDIAYLEEVITHEWQQIENITTNRYILASSLLKELKLKNVDTNLVFNFQTALLKFNESNTLSQRVYFSSQIELILSKINQLAEFKKYERVQYLLSELSYSQDKLRIKQGEFNQNIDIYNSTIMSSPYKYLNFLFNFNAKEPYKVVVN